MVLSWGSGPMLAPAGIDCPVMNAKAWRREQKGGFWGAA
jgi:hypothetical protein